MQWEEVISDPLLRKLVLAFVIILAGFAVKRMILTRLFRLFDRLSGSTRTRADDHLVENLPGPIGGLVMVVALYGALNLFRGDVDGELILSILDNGFLLFVVFFGVRMLFALIDSLSIFMEEWSGDRTAPVDDQLAVITRKSLKILAGIMAVLFLIQNMGYSVSGLVASLGLGGLTVALAAKDAVSNFFGSVIILLDSPFKIGDWIKTGGVEGVVEEIGFRSTKIRTFEKSLVTVPNFAIANQSVENFTIRDRRRITFSVGIEYRTPLPRIEVALVRIRKLIEQTELIHNDFYLVNLNRMADSALEIFIYCFTATSVWADYLDIQERLILDILQILEEEGIGVAFPSQSVYLEKLPEKMPGKLPEN